MYLLQYSVEKDNLSLLKTIRLRSPEFKVRHYLELIHTDRNGDGLVMGQREVPSPPDRVISEKYQNYFATAAEAHRAYSLRESPLWRVDRHSGAFTLLGLLPGWMDHSKPVFVLSQDEIVVFMELDHFARNRTTVLYQWTFEKGFVVLGQLHGSVIPAGLTRVGDRLIGTDGKVFFEVVLTWPSMTHLSSDVSQKSRS